MTTESRVIERPRMCVRLPVGPLTLAADLRLPWAPVGVVLFCQVSGRHSPRADFVARELGHHGFATLLVDLLTRDEEAVDVQTGQYRLDIDLLAARILAASGWLAEQPETRGLPLGYFAVSVGAAAAVSAAARIPERVRAIVCRGAWLDLVLPSLPRVQAPTLLIVGSRDRWALQVNTAALAELKCRKRLEVVPGAAHLFKEPDAIDRVAGLACTWFSLWLSGSNEPTQHRSPSVAP